ncbi:MAG: 50S ribosomal protein L3 [Candidatus Dadabacteria bacterium]|nr:50S ribosomal protein L3 [Candidatus Dadabacteria bacterium]
MIQGLIGKKRGMTEFFNDDMVKVITTVVEAGSVYCGLKKTVDSDGYDAVQLGFGDVKSQRLTRSAKGHFANSGVAPKAKLKEFSATVEDCNVGDIVKVDIFKVGDVLDVTARSKGKGFAGTIKRHNFSRQPMSHGGMAHRRPGSVGQASYPAKVWKGLKMSGRMGGENVTIQGVRVVDIDIEKNLLFVKGSVPGPVGGTVLLRHTSKGAKHASN